jgi:hypothetical protein
VWAKEHGTRDAEVRALTAASLNGRPAQPLVDPNRDLTKVGFSWRRADWVLPLVTPLPPRDQRFPDDTVEALERLAATQTATTTGATTPAAK